MLTSTSNMMKTAKDGDEPIVLKEEPGIHSDSLQSEEDTSSQVIYFNVIKRK